MSKLSDFVGGPEGILSKYEEFTTSGTWTKDPAATWVYVECIGGGGSGGVSTYGNSNVSGTGGAGGAFVDTLLRASDLPSSVNITVGAGGLSPDGGQASTGGKGGGSFFGSYISAPGGNPGFPSGTSSNSLPGFYAADATSTISTVLLLFAGYGGSHSNRDGSRTIFGGAGGGAARSEVGSGLGGISQRHGNGGNANNEEQDTSAEDGFFPGGGGGGRSYSSNASRKAGNGGDGVVRIWQW